MDRATSVKVVIAKRNRLEHTLNCLRFLDYANEHKYFDVNVCVCDDTYSEFLTNDYSFANLSVTKIHLKNEGAFNKSQLLNEGIKNSTSGTFDYMMIVDCDMIYSPTTFSVVNNLISQGYDYVVCHGWKLGEGTQNLVNSANSFDDVYKLPKEEFNVGPSQVSISNKGYQIIQQYFPGKLYREEFAGWGGEDSVLSSVSRKLALDGKLRKTEVSNVWLHQYHEFNGNHPLYKSNLQLFKQIDAMIMHKNLEDRCQR